MIKTLTNKQRDSDARMDRTRTHEDNVGLSRLGQKRDIAVYVVVDHFLCGVFFWRDVFCADVLRVVIYRSFMAGWQLSVLVLIEFFKRIVYCRKRSTFLSTSSDSAVA